MQRIHLIGFAALAFALAAQGQPVPTPAASSASAAMPSPAKPGKPGKRPLTPEEKRDSATMPGELRPAAPVVPQVNIPIGKGAKEPSMNASGGPANVASAPGGINDAVARCKAQVDPKERAKCTSDSNQVR